MPHFELFILTSTAWQNSTKTLIPSCEFLSRWSLENYFKQTFLWGIRIFCSLQVISRTCSQLLLISRVRVNASANNRHSSIFLWHHAVTWFWAISCFRSELFLLFPSNPLWIWNPGQRDVFFCFIQQLLFSPTQKALFRANCGISERAGGLFVEGVWMQKAKIKQLCNERQRERERETKICASCYRMFGRWEVFRLRRIPRWCAFQRIPKAVPPLCVSIDAQKSCQCVWR